MRSKTLCVSAVLATVWSSLLSFPIIVALVNGGVDAVWEANQIAWMLADLVEDAAIALIAVNVITSLYLLHLFLFLLGALLGWIGFFAKKSGAAKSSAILYLLGTVFFPIVLFVGIPITIVGFAGAKRQKNINASLHTK